MSLPRAPRAPRPGFGAGFPRLPIKEGFRLLTRAVGQGVNKVWIGCLAYKRFRYGLKEGHMSVFRMHPEAALEALDVCLNPFEFLEEDEE